MDGGNGKRSSSHDQRDEMLTDLKHHSVDTATSFIGIGSPPPHPRWCEDGSKSRRQPMHTESRVLLCQPTPFFPSSSAQIACRISIIHRPFKIIDSCQLLQCPPCEGLPRFPSALGWGASVSTPLLVRLVLAHPTLEPAGDVLPSLHPLCRVPCQRLCRRWCLETGVSGWWWFWAGLLTCANTHHFSLAVNTSRHEQATSWEHALRVSVVEGYWRCSSRRHDEGQGPGSLVLVVMMESTRSGR
jgi:hypothetical protein